MWHTTPIQRQQAEGQDRLTGASAHLEVGDEVLKVMQLEQSLLALRHDSHGNAQEDLGAVFSQQDVDDAGREGGREGAAEEGQKPLGCIQDGSCSMLLHNSPGSPSLARMATDLCGQMHSE